MQEYLTILIARGRDLLATLQSPDMSADAQDIALAVHALRGSAGTFGFRRLDTVATEFERIVESGAPGIDKSAMHLIETLRDTLTLLEDLTCQSLGMSKNLSRIPVA
jgi:HPt (histidine-containing phosphotransfer) domain-containing protein